MNDKEHRILEIEKTILIWIARILIVSLAYSAYEYTSLEFTVFEGCSKQCEREGIPKTVFNSENQCARECYGFYTDESRQDYVSRYQWSNPVNKKEEIKPDINISNLIIYDVEADDEFLSDFIPG